MTKEIEILDYSGKKTMVKIDDFDTVGAIDLKVVTGDEILVVIRKDFTVEEYDSSNDRLRDYFDEQYRIYESRTDQNMIDNEEWRKRESSYDF